MATNILFDVTIRNAKPTDKNQRLNDGGACICSSNPTVLNGGDLITPSKASAKHYHWAFTRKPH